MLLHDNIPSLDCYSKNLETSVNKKMYGKIHQKLLIFFPLLIKSGSADNHSIFNLLLGGVETYQRRIHHNCSLQNLYTLVIIYSLDYSNYFLLLRPRYQHDAHIYAYMWTAFKNRVSRSHKVQSDYLVFASQTPIILEVPLDTTDIFAD